jgi:DNA-binding CsgD family transcriptional regulator
LSDINDRLNKYPPLTHAEDLKQICKPLDTLGINYFSHVHVDKKNEFSAVGLKPEFVKLYFEKAYYNYDIHMAQKNTEQAYIIWDFLELTEQTKELDRDSQIFDCHHSFTIVQPVDNGNEYFHFATSAANTYANNNYLKNLSHLKRFILYFKEKIHEHKQLATSFQHKFKIIAENASFYTDTTIQTHNDEIFKQQVALNHVHVSDRGKYLTKREFECLYWLSKAKTIEAIAIILKITPRTVKAHIANIKDKLGCDNLFQLGTMYEKIRPYV